MLLPRVPDHIRAVAPYVPGKPIEETRREYGIRSRIIRLASNENPLGPSPKALQALRKSLPSSYLYPDGSAFALKRALSKHLGVAPDRLITGNGSNELIDLLIRAYSVPGDAIAVPEKSFVAYALSAQIHGARTLEAPNRADYRMNLEALAARVKRDSRARLVFLANPNNPTGAHATKAELEGFLGELARIRDGSTLVALDCAYLEYATASDYPDPMQLLARHRNVIVLRTFSKIYGLAGLRAGFAVADPEIIAGLEKVRMPFNVNSLALAACEAALADQAFLRRSRALNSRELPKLAAGLERLGARAFPSQGNFVLADFARLGLSGKDLDIACLKQGVILRPLANYGIPSALRITVGTANENRAALRALASAIRGRRH